ncbi:MAG: hypothetical protein ACPGJV_06825 [Bacteriovoracaceae bacterium]
MKFLILMTALLTSFTVIANEQEEIVLKSICYEAADAYDFLGFSDEQECIDSATNLSTRKLRASRGESIMKSSATIKMVKIQNDEVVDYIVANCSVTYREHADQPQAIDCKELDRM